MTARRAIVAAALLAGLAAAAPVARADTIWDRVLAGSPAAKAQNRPAPPANLDEYGKQMWWGDYHALRVAPRRTDYGLTGSSIYFLQKAILGYERAIAAAPDKAEPHLRLAEVLYGNCLLADRHCHPMREADIRTTVLHEWNEFERLAPKDPRMQYIWRQRAIEYTKLATDEGLKKALADYTKICDYVGLDSMGAELAGIMASNRAEVHMMLGQMSQAIEWYKRALDLMIKAEWAFGLAVAYDRDGQSMRAREVMHTYLTRTTLAGFVKDVREGTLFYVPRGEVYYYFAVMHEALGNYDLAVSAFQRFIASGAHPQFQRRARAHIAELQHKMGPHWHPPRNQDWSRFWYRRPNGSQPEW